MNKYAKMRRTNKKIKRYLIENGYDNIQFFQHTRYSKDYKVDGLKFDGFCTLNNTVVFFQCKSNKVPSRKLISLYREASIKYSILCVSITNFDYSGVEIYS